MENHLFKQIRDNWMLLTLVVSLIIGYTTLKSDVVQAKSDIKDLKTDSERISNIEIRVERIDTSVQFIKQRI